MALGFWSESDYLQSWCRALRELGSGTAVTSCLVASITDPEVSNFLFCWPLYREGEKVFVQNSVIFLDELVETFNVEEPWRFVGPRRAVSEYGDRISEWSTDISEVEKFLSLKMG
ncbi:hypothetical protein OG352_13450 [Streptomyces sp. NBC_01485]